MPPTIDQLRRLDETLQRERRVLVEVTEETRWLRPELANVSAEAPPTSGYALAALATTTIQDRRDQSAFVTDVNAKHAWRQVFTYYATFADAARHIGS